MPCLVVAATEHAYTTHTKKAEEIISTEFEKLIFCGCNMFDLVEVWKKLKPVLIKKKKNSEV